MRFITKHHRFVLRLALSLFCLCSTTTALQTTVRIASTTVVPIFDLIHSSELIKNQGFKQHTKAKGLNLKKRVRRDADVNQILEIFADDIELMKTENIEQQSKIYNLTTLVAQLQAKNEMLQDVTDLNSKKRERRDAEINQTLEISAGDIELIKTENIEQQSKIHNLTTLVAQLQTKNDVLQNATDLNSKRQERRDAKINQNLEISADDIELIKNKNIEQQSKMDNLTTLVAQLQTKNDMLQDAQSDQKAKMEVISELQYSCGDDIWVPYKDKKCFKNLNVEANLTQARELCSSVSNGNKYSLLTIDSKEEEQFVKKLIFGISGFNWYAWMDAVRVRNFNNVTFKWNDYDSGRDMKYSNWETPLPNLNNDDFNPVALFPFARYEKWYLKPSHHTYLVICQKPSFVFKLKTAVKPKKTQ